LIHLSKTDLQGLGITMAGVVANIEHLIKLQAQGKAWIAPKTNVSTDGRIKQGEPHLFFVRWPLVTLRSLRWLIKRRGRTRVLPSARIILSW